MLAINSHQLLAGIILGYRNPKPTGKTRNLHSQNFVSMQMSYVNVNVLPRRRSFVSAQNSRRPTSQHIFTALTLRSSVNALYCVAFARRLCIIIRRSKCRAMTGVTPRILAEKDVVRNWHDVCCVVHNNVEKLCIFLAKFEACVVHAFLLRLQLGKCDLCFHHQYNTTSDYTTR